MISINAFSLLDLFAVVVSTYVLLVFLYRSVRVTNRRVDLLFTGVVVLVWLQGVLVLISDNIVPVGVAADSIPDAATRTLSLYRLMYAAGILLLPVLTHFALRYTQSSHLRAWRVAWLYAAGLLLIPLCYTDGFLTVRDSPIEQNSGWLCAVPWQPKAGPFSSVFIILWLAVYIYIQWLFRHRTRATHSGSAFEQSNFVWCGVTLWGASGLISVLLGTLGYAGVDPGMLLLTTSMVVLAIGLAEDHLHAERRTDFIRGIFGRYVADDVVEKLLASPGALELGGDRRVLSVMFADIRGFTALAERLRPEQVVELLNLYLGAMSDVIMEYHGTINEFLGDGIVAIFGAPIQRSDCTENAVRCALAMQRAMPAVNAEVVRLGVPDLEMGIGINTGEVVVGNIGSMKRAKYGVVGSNVNLAARIESATVGGQILVSQSTVDSLSGRLEIQRQLVLNPKGAKESISVYDVTGITGDVPLSLFPRAENLTRLAAQPLLECMLVSGDKQVVGAPFTARILALSNTSAQLDAGRSIDVATNLRMRLLPRSHGGAAIDFYAKVISDGPVPGQYLVRFTSVPLEAWEAGGAKPKDLAAVFQPRANG